MPGDGRRRHTDRSSAHLCQAPRRPARQGAAAEGGGPVRQSRERVLHTIVSVFETMIDVSVSRSHEKGIDTLACLLIGYGKKI